MFYFPQKSVSHIRDAVPTVKEQIFEQFNYHTELVSVSGLTGRGFLVIVHNKGVGVISKKI